MALTRSETVETDDGVRLWTMERALPRVRRVILPEAGHLPWVEDPKGFWEAVTAALR